MKISWKSNEDLWFEIKCLKFLNFHRSKLVEIEINREIKFNNIINSYLYIYIFIICGYIFR